MESCVSREDGMTEGDDMTRRTFLERAGLVAATTDLIVQSRDTHAQIAVSNSSGSESPRLKAPPHACDCHMHIYDPARFRMAPSPRVPPTDAAVPQYRLLQKRIGTTRVVIVTPRNYATLNQVTIDAIGQLGPDARGVAVVHPTVTDAELKRFHDAGVRGIRFSLTDPATAVVKVEMVEPLSKRVADLGWHVQFNVEGEQSRRMGGPPAASADAAGVRPPRTPAAAGGRGPSFARHHPRPHRPGPGVGQALGRLFEYPGRSALRGRDQDRAGLREGGARAAGVGQRLAASERTTRPETERRGAVRLVVGMGTGPGDAPPHSRRESGNPVRIHHVGRVIGGRLAARAAHRRRRRAAHHDRTDGGQLGGATGLARSARHLARLPRATPGRRGSCPRSRSRSSSPISSPPRPVAPCRCSSALVSSSGALSGAAIGAAAGSVGGGLIAGIVGAVDRHTRRPRHPRASRRGVRQRSSGGLHRRRRGDRRRAADRDRTAMSRFDAIIIGAGQAGPSLAGRLTRRRHDGRHRRAQPVRRHLRQHRLHADQDARRQRVCRTSRAPRRRLWRRLGGRDTRSTCRA